MLKIQSNYRSERGGTMARESTKVISVRLDAGNYEKLQKMAVLNKSTISAVASEVIKSSFEDIERVDKRVEHLEELVFSVLDHLTLMQAFNKEVYTALLVRKARTLSEEEKKEARVLLKDARQSLDAFLYAAAKKIMNEDFIWESQRLIDELLTSHSHKGEPQ